MNKEKLKKEIKSFVKKGKKASKAIYDKIKLKTQDFIEDFKERRKAAKFAKQLKAKAKNKKSKLATQKEIYDKKERSLTPKSSFFDIKPMSARGQKVSTKRPLFSYLKNFSFTPRVYFTDFTVKIIYLGSSLVCAWLLGLSFAQEPKPFCAFLAFFLTGLSLRYIKSFGGSLGYGFLTGFFANLFIFDWIFDTVLFGTGNGFLSAGALLGLAMLLALPFMFFALFAWQYKHKLWLYPFASACAWVALELIAQVIAYKGFAFPWFVLGYTQYANLELIQISSILGAYGISFFIVFCSFSATLVLGKNIVFKKRFVNLLLIGLIWFIFSAYGKQQLAAFPQGERKNLQVAILQPNTHQAMISEDMAQVQKTLDTIADTLQNQEKLDLVIWPESTIPGYLEEGPLKDFMAKVSLDTKASQIAGASARKPQGKKTKGKKTELISEDLDFVAAGLYQQGKLTAQHHKRKLVPFGEFLPFQKQLKSFYEQNGITSLTGSFVQGSGPAQILSLREGDAKISFGVQICFESIFPILWRLEALGGTEFFVNISNDGWFLNTAAPYQHLRINIFRAVENNRPILRSANSGLSAIIDSFGRIEYQSSLNEEEIKIFTLSLPQTPNHTFYTIYGDIFAFLCLFLTLAFSYNCLESEQNYD